MELDGILNGNQSEPIEEVAEVVAEQPEEEQPEVEVVAEGEQGESLPTSDKPTEKTVPLSALESVRTERKDWKEKALRLEGQIAAMQASQQAQKPQYQDELDPITQLKEEMFNERLNNSEMLLRQEGHEDIDQKLEIFQQAIQENPALGAELRKQVHPWKWMYQQASTRALMQEIGNDPAAYRKRLEDEIRASIQPVTPPPANPQAQIPQSLAGARSSGARSAPTWTGPSSLDSILN